jgi:hypothetical protein
MTSLDSPAVNLPMVSQLLKDVDTAIGVMGANAGKG